MNEFIEQFLIEARELVAEGSADLAALDLPSNQPGRLANAFRAFHTLKGSAAIVDFDAMARVLHAVEDALSAVRAGSRRLDAALIADGLAALDQVSRWLDATERDGSPPAGNDVERAAERLAARFVAPAAASAEVETGSDWTVPLLEAAARHGARSALRYVPPANALLEGLDPIALMTAVPGLVALEIDLRRQDRLDTFDPYRSQLTLVGLSILAPATIGPLPAGMDVRPLVGLVRTSAADAGFLLEEQVRVLDAGDATGRAGRIGAVGVVAERALRWSGRNEDADAVRAALAASLGSGDPGPLRAVIVGSLPAAEVAVQAAPASDSVRSMRIDVTRIDELVTLTGELLVASNTLAHLSRLAESNEPGLVAGLLKEQAVALDRVVRSVQRVVIDLRVVPLRTVFQRFPRLVRDMAGDLGKEIALVVSGEDTEADKTVVEALFESLLHVIRNAADHGIEPPADRRAAGKDPRATIAIRASRVADAIEVEVSDDGRGIDVGRVRAVAAGRGTATAEALAAMTDTEIIGLIFAPGFSTATTVTAISGRGVGMDAVQTVIERLGGRVAVESGAGKGTIVRLTLPFTVMMTRIMTVTVDGQDFGVPLEAVVETVLVERDRIASIGAGRAFAHRQRTIPMVDLAASLGRGVARSDKAAARVVVVSAGGLMGGLEVDALGRQLDVMLKPADGLLAGVTGIAGTTILGDGAVLIVLDVQDLLS